MGVWKHQHKNAKMFYKCWGRSLERKPNWLYFYCCCCFVISSLRVIPAEVFMVSWRVQSVMPSYIWWHWKMIPSLKLTFSHLKNWMVGIGSFPFGARRVIFSGARNVGFGEGRYSVKFLVQSPKVKEIILNYLAEFIATETTRRPEVRSCLLGSLGQEVRING